MSMVRFRPWPPPFSAQPLSVGRFRLWIPQDTWGSGAFCVCQDLAEWAAKTASSLLFCPLFSSKETPTFSPHRTHIAMRDKGLYVCRFFGFARQLGVAEHKIGGFFGLGQLQGAHHDGFNHEPMHAVVTAAGFYAFIPLAGPYLMTEPWWRPLSKKMDCSIAMPTISAPSWPHPLPSSSLSSPPP